VRAVLAFLVTVVRVFAVQLAAALRWVLARSTLGSLHRACLVRSHIPACANPVEGVGAGHVVAAGGECVAINRARRVLGSARLLVRRAPHDATLSVGARGSATALSHLA